MWLQEGPHADCWAAERGRSPRGQQRPTSSQAGQAAATEARRTAGGGPQGLARASLANDRGRGGVKMPLAAAAAGVREASCAVFPPPGCPRLVGPAG